LSGGRDPIDDTVPIRRGRRSEPPVPEPRGERRGREAHGGELLEPGGVAGVGRRVPIVYGARGRPGAGAESEDRVAAPSQDSTVRSAEEGLSRAGRRAALPSLERRETRSRSLTLAAYAAVILLSMVGLAAVAVAAFR